MRDSWRPVRPERSCRPEAGRQRRGSAAFLISVKTGTYVEVIGQVQQDAMAGMNSLLKRHTADGNRTR
jgi:hypothetical protein